MPCPGEHPTGGAEGALRAVHRDPQDRPSPRPDLRVPRVHQGGGPLRARPHRALAARPDLPVQPRRTVQAPSPAQAPRPRMAPGQPWQRAPHLDHTLGHHLHRHTLTAAVVGQAEKVSQRSRSPESRPRLNQRGPLLGRAVGPGLGIDGSTGSLLDAVVAHGRGRTERFVDIRGRQRDPVAVRLSVGELAPRLLRSSRPGAPAGQTKRWPAWDFAVAGRVSGARCPAASAGDGRLRGRRCTPPRTGP